MSSPKRIGIVIACVLCCTGLASVAAAMTANGPDESQLVTHEDPDPSTDPVAIGKQAERALAQKDYKGYDQAIEQMRTEIQSRMSPDDREAAVKADREVQVPEGTAAYISPDVSEAQIAGCKEMVANGDRSQICRLIVLYADGKARAGAYSPGELKAALEEAAR